MGWVGKRGGKKEQLCNEKKENIIASQGYPLLSLTTKFE